MANMCQDDTEVVLGTAMWDVMTAEATKDHDETGHKDQQGDGLDI